MISTPSRGGRRYMPCVFTEQGVAIAAILSAIRQLMNPPPSPKRRPIGFTADLREKS